MGTEKKGEYGADQIQILEGLEGILRDVENGSLYEKGPECILEVHPPKGFIIWYMKLWTMRSMNHWQVTVIRFM